MAKSVDPVRFDNWHQITKPFHSTLNGLLGRFQGLTSTTSDNFQITVFDVSPPNQIQVRRIGIAQGFQQAFHVDTLCHGTRQTWRRIHRTQQTFQPEEIWPVEIDWISRPHQLHTVQVRAGILHHRSQPRDRDSRQSKRIIRQPVPTERPEILRQDDLFQVFTIGRGPTGVVLAHKARDNPLDGSIGRKVSSMTTPPLTVFKRVHSRHCSART
ncbi:hypothetical protein C3B59_18255 [Cryobacterium zongtaii]|uniref:Uncharacterized protein n=1 Tax=Cryobacterium zongtaii TaxID=1259217 RepID=A0A2S3Z5H3_9MICO|nr:hypothetical protein C3B59_18255 [Cryobacterium zongtaii]